MNETDGREHEDSHKRQAQPGWSIKLKFTVEALRDHWVSVMNPPQST